MKFHWGTATDRQIDTPQWIQKKNMEIKGIIKPATQDLNSLGYDKYSISLFYICTAV